MPKGEGSPQVFFRSGALYPQLAERAHVPTGATPGSTRRTLRLDRTLGNPSSSVGSTLGLTAHRDLTRYYALLRLSLPRFTVGEASFLVDLLNDTITEPYTASLLWALASDALEDDLALVARLRMLTPFEALAVADACERAWVLMANGMATDEAIRAVGLVERRNGRENGGDA